MSQPANYIITRKTTSKPDGPMRVVVASRPAEGNDAGLVNGGTFYFAPGEGHSVPAAVAAEFMADAYHQEHFDIDPALPKAVLKEAVKADEARAVEPATDAAPVEDAGGKKSTTRGK